MKVHSQGVYPLTADDLPASFLSTHNWVEKSFRYFKTRPKDTYILVNQYFVRVGEKKMTDVTIIISDNDRIILRSNKNSKHFFILSRSKVNGDYILQEYNRKLKVFY